MDGSIRTRRASSWRLVGITWIVVFAAVALLAWAAWTPDTASAMPCAIDPVTEEVDCPDWTDPVTYERRITADMQPRFVGWARLTAPDIQIVCIRAPCIQRVTTWRWSGRAWSSGSLPESTWVYRYPYTTGWSWAWTSSTGWLAVRSRQVLVRTETRRCDSAFAQTDPQAMVCWILPT